MTYGIRTDDITIPVHILTLSAAIIEANMMLLNCEALRVEETKREMNALARELRKMAANALERKQ